ncbi:O-antigen ligase family protein [candidate division KSB1 bacterium]|nr:O-antigen ligase family protein [candidate division KSB1 bacterium]TDI91502.1 MAG: O-antigen ligase family protein [Caldithrix sp.]TDI92963.1 MAG: O-antigen ligase family protein [Caldithrix sp.]
MPSSGVKNIQRALLFLLVFLAPLKIGWIFRHHNGIFIADAPLFFLLLLAFSPSIKFKFHWKLPMLGFIVWCTLTGVFAERFDIVFSEVTRFARAYLAFLCVINFTRAKKDIDIVFYAILSAFTLESLIGFLEWRRGFLGLTFLGEDSFYFRVGGFFVHPNIFADYLIFFLPVLLRLFIFHKHRKITRNILYGILFLIASGALFATLSRGAWLSFAGAIVLMMLFTLFKIKFYPKIVSGFAVMALLATVAAIHYTPTILNQFQADHRESAASVRMPLNKIALQMIKDHGVFGVGLGNYTEHTHKYAEAAVSDDHHYWELLQVVHNTFLLNLAEAGVPGFLLYLWMLVLIFKHGKKATDNSDPFISNVALGFLTGFLAMLVAFIAGPDGRNHQIQMVFWIYAGVLFNFSRMKDPRKISKKKVRRPVIQDPRQVRTVNVNNQSQTGESLWQPNR